MQKEIFFSSSISTNSVLPFYLHEKHGAKPVPVLHQEERFYQSGVAAHPKKKSDITWTELDSLGSNQKTCKRLMMTTSGNGEKKKNGNLPIWLSDPGNCADKISLYVIAAQCSHTTAKDLFYGRTGPISTIAHTTATRDQLRPRVRTSRRWR